MSVSLPSSGRLLAGASLTLPEEPAATVATVFAPTVAILCEPTRDRALASAVALALADACGSPCALAAAAGRGTVAALPLTPAARRGAALLRRRGYDAAGVGRLAWVADLRVSRRAGSAGAGPDDCVDPCASARAVGSAGAGPDDPRTSARTARSSSAERAGSAELRASLRARAGGSAGAESADRPAADPVDPLGDDPVGAVAAISLELAGAARALSVPAALAIPLARSSALDRVLGWHDAIVVVEDGRSTTPELSELVRESLAALDRPVAPMAPPSRAQARAAAAGIRAPSAAARAIAELELARARS
ncbi:hypothetical protein [Conexibacter arvalis]|uniref:Uncharacterized protein n=1 Tax=Conexibacter arvalis TaxID=912552 RepID=A0A840IKP1_9ACTN|nr:hypothetical protein [Conexibacter arvalis]MBB4664490.1 hypothetical protein [Conexibacter arvalis]